MTEWKISQWLKGIGDKVEAGDMLLVVESDKADMDVEAYEEGYLAAIITDEGESAAVGAPVCVLADKEEDIDKVRQAFLSGGAAAPAAAAPASDVPMEMITMPALSSTMTEGKISQWLKSVGDMMLVVESDKADMDVEAYEEGYLAAILTDEGETAAVGAPVAALAVNEADIEAVAAAAKGGAVGGAAPAAAAAPAPAPAAAPVVNTGRIVAS